MARYCPLFSGSEGNCTYLGTANGGVLVDAGVSAKRMTEALLQRGIDPDSLHGIFLTHEHSDHISGLKVFLKKHPMPVYGTRGTLEAVADKDALPAGATVYAVDGTVAIGDLQVTAFATPHDSRESCGYRVIFPDERTAAIATDIGHLTDTVKEAVSGCDLVHIESNHDVRMLECGPYPFYLKERILSRVGHLSNERCAALLPSLLENGTTRFFLAHLSRENNTPLLAQMTAQTALKAMGALENRDFLLGVAAPVGTDDILIF